MKEDFLLVRVPLSNGQAWYFENKRKQFDPGVNEEGISEQFVKENLYAYKLTNQQALEAMDEIVIQAGTKKVEVVPLEEVVTTEMVWGNAHQLGTQELNQMMDTLKSYLQRPEFEDNLLVPLNVTLKVKLVLSSGTIAKGLVNCTLVPEDRGMDTPVLSSVYIQAQVVYYARLLKAMLVSKFKNQYMASVVLSTSNNAVSLEGQSKFYLGKYQEYELTHRLINRDKELDKLEHGNTPSSWSVAPEDQEEVTCYRRLNMGLHKVRSIQADNAIVFKNFQVPLSPNKKYGFLVRYHYRYMNPKYKTIYIEKTPQELLGPWRTKLVDYLRFLEDAWESPIELVDIRPCIGSYRKPLKK